MDPDQQQQPEQQESPDYKLPHPTPASSAVGLAATVGGMLSAVPLVGSAYNGVAAAYDQVDALVHPENSAEDDEATFGHLINAIPLVGFARNLM